MADKFVEIAEIKSARQEMLAEPKPIQFKEIICGLTNTDGKPIETQKKISSKEELLKELGEMRKYYEPFLRNLAPKCKVYNKRIKISSFERAGEKVTIPEYGGPLGYAAIEYKTEVEIDEFDGRAVYLHFDGADYHATVYVNDVCVGIHEGFFSPFEFDITDVAQKGKNTVRFTLINDYAYMGSSLTADEAIITEGEKLYAATGIGYDDPEVGWHHCPPGMGIYDLVYIEIRNRINLTDLYIRPLPDTYEAEAWIEVENADHLYKNIEFELSLYGQNFECTVFENKKYLPWLALINNIGTEKALMNGYETDLPGVREVAKFRKNIYKIRFNMKEFKYWNPESPFLYQLQVKLIENGEVCDTRVQQFGMRTFSQNIKSVPKGMFYLNGEKCRLRGANTMGFEQQDVMNNNTEQLIDDILLAKICNMNFWRLTQRPVQETVYEYCDKLGLMTQTDLPLFGVMRRSKVCEGIRQSEEMIRITRKHPCNVLITYINEPFPNGYDNIHRHLERDELERFFKACDIVVKISCPGCVIKHVDGDYDPPGIDTLPDNHCYTLWYNNHGIEFRKLHKGYWQKVSKDWLYGCGEYGAEGLDFKEIMEKHYPREWIKEPFSPKNIIKAQSFDMQHKLFDKPRNMDEWIEITQEHQAFSARFMTEAFRRDYRMVSNAIHLFIDAWPSGWMKAIMDFKRNPKPAYFAYRNALEPIMVSLRTDRFTYTSGETAKIEAYICNDTNRSLRECKLYFELFDGESLVMSESCAAECGAVTSNYISSASFIVPEAEDRKKFMLKAILTDAQDNVVTYNEFEFEVFADVKIDTNDNIEFITDLTPGEHMIADGKIVVSSCDNRIYVSGQSGHRATAEFRTNDFRFWYDGSTDMLSVMTNTVFEADGFNPILTASVCNANGVWEDKLVLAEKRVGEKTYVVSTLNFRTENPVAKRLLRNLYRL